jgi:DNA-binding MarR family transcriptional regulator
VTDLITDSPATLKLEEFLPYRLAVLASLVSKGFARSCGRYDLSMTEWSVLTRLGEAGEITGKALGDKNQMHKTKVSRTVAVLLQKGLISSRPNPVDLRATFLRLTPRGLAVYEECTPLAAEFLKRLEADIPAADRQALDRSLANLARRSRELTYDGVGLSST